LNRVLEFFPNNSPDDLSFRIDDKKKIKSVFVIIRRRKYIENQVNRIVDYLPA
jgi:hypothetical protein